MRIEEWLRGLHPALREAAWELAALVEDEVPDALLRRRWGVPMWSVAGVDFCYLTGTRERVSLGFQRGSELDDPGGVLQTLGKARDARHVILRAGGAVPPQARGLVAQAAALARPGAT